MNWLWKHAIVGNDTSPWVVAGTRALIGATITGALSFFTVWQGTDDVRVLVSAGVVPFLSYLGVRLGIEGVIDTRMKP